jgi:hypothetical protein
MSHILIEHGTNRKPIESLAKSSKSYEIEGQSRFVGHRFALGGKMYGDKRCIHCGKWFHWKASDEANWFINRNIDETVPDRSEPAHCGSSHCQEYHHRWLKALDKRAKENDEKIERAGIALMKHLKHKGIL